MLLLKRKKGYALFNAVSRRDADVELIWMALQRVLNNAYPFFRAVSIYHDTGLNFRQKKWPPVATIIYRLYHYTQLSLLPSASPSSLHLIWRDGTTVEIACL